MNVMIMHLQSHKTERPPVKIFKIVDKTIRSKYFSNKPTYKISGSEKNTPGFESVVIKQCFAWHEEHKLIFR